MRFKNEEDKHSSFLCLFTAHEAAIHRYVRSLVYKREDALDVMQKTAIVLWKKFDQLKKEDEFKKWSFAVARFEVLAWRRDVARSKERLVLSSETIELMADELDNETEQLELEREAIIQHCLGKLKQNQRSALKSLYEKSYETKILAQRFGKSITGFYQWIYRIRQKLSECAKKMTQPHSVN